MNARGCAYGEDGQRHWLVSEGLAAVVFNSAGARVVSAALPTIGTPHGLHAARGADGQRVWIIDTIGMGGDPSRTFCLRGGEVLAPAVDAAGLSVSGNIVAWIDAVRMSFRGADADVRASTVEDFCAGRTAERAHTAGGNIYHQYYESLIGADPITSSTPFITCDDAMLALRPDGRFLIAARRAWSPNDPTVMQYPILQAGAWATTGEGAPVTAHESWRRSEAGPAVLALPRKSLRAAAVVPGFVPSTWGGSADLGAEMPPSEADAGSFLDAGVPGDGGTVEHVDGGSPPDDHPPGSDEEDKFLCRCSAPRPGRPPRWAWVFALGLLVLELRVLARRARNR
jgi:hypothetical protein